MGGKTKKKVTNKQQQQQLAGFRPLNTQVLKVPGILLNRTVLPVDRSKSFQTPHESQESMPELTDDTSPKTPLIAGGWKPFGTTSDSGNQRETTAINITSIKQNNWLKFQKSLKKPNQIVINKNQPQTDIFEEESTNEIEEMKPNISEQTSETEIHWELNEIDEKAEKDMIRNEAPSKPVVLQGTPSEIKLFSSNKTMTSEQKIDKEEVVQEIGLLGTKSSNILANALPAKPSRSQHSQPHLVLQNSYPKGVPRSFLANQQNTFSIEPQDHNPGKFFAENNQPTWATNPIHTREFEKQVYIQTNEAPEQSPEQQYSPSDVYSDFRTPEQENDGSETPDSQSYKRPSAFQRLGPQAQPKKPKLTINLLCGQDQSVREVVDVKEPLEEEDIFTPVHLRESIKNSSEEIIVKYLPYWPWKKNIGIRKSVTARNSKYAMVVEQEQMEEAYERENVFIQVTVRGYPPSWKKETVLDAILEGVRGKSLIPCFIEFKPKQCKFLTIKCRAALTAIHKLGFYIRKDDVELGITISQTDVTLKQIEFIPRLVLRKQLAQDYDGERKLSLKEFTIKKDVSHFIYFPLNRLTNQTELVKIQSTIAWDYLTDLDLSHNRITSIDGFELPITMPRLKHLDLSYNCIEKVTVLLRSREMSLRSLKLEGNPLCHDYIDPGHYVRVVKMIFPALTELDGVPIHLKGDFPQHKRNYCPNEAQELANKFLEVFFPLLESTPEDRPRIEELYDEKAVMTITYKYSLRHSALHRKFRNIFLRTRVVEENDLEYIEGGAAISRVISKWPAMKHDPFTFTVDVIHHTDTSTILRVDGILKLTSDSLADDEHLVAFSRTLLLTTKDGTEYKITNEMIYWDEPCKEWAHIAFQMDTIRVSKWPISLKLDSNPDEELKGKLIEIFMQVTNLEKAASERCLEQKEWNLQTALELFMKLVKLDDLKSLKESN